MSGRSARRHLVLPPRQVILTCSGEQVAQIRVAGGAAAGLGKEWKRLVLFPGCGQSQTKVDAYTLVFRRELGGGFERLLGIGPTPLQIIAIARVVPDFRIFRRGLERFLVMDLGLGESPQPIEAPPMRRCASTDRLIEMIRVSCFR